MVKYVFSKNKWDSELKKLHNGENPFTEKCKWVDICDGLEVEKVNSTIGIIDIGKKYEYVTVSLKCCEEIYLK